MPFKCPQCGQVLEAPDGVFAMEGKCRFCGAEIVSPAAAGASATLKQGAAPSSFGAPSAPPPPFQGGQPYAAYHGAPSRGSGVAVASVILAVLGFFTCGLTTIPGLICGILALTQTGPNSDRRSGRTMAVAGTVLSGLFVLMIPIQAAILFPVFAKARERARGTSCMSNAKQLGMAMMMYADDNNGRLPAPAKWDSGINNYVKSQKVFACPSVPDGAARYKMNAAMGSVGINRLVYPAVAVALFDAAPGGKPFGGPRDVVARHNRHGNELDATFTFADGRASIMAPAQLTELAWKPRQTEHKNTKAP